MSREQEIIADSLIGDEARKFKESDLGQCVIGMARHESQLALEGLAVVNPTDVQAIERLQNRVALGRQFEAFVDELISKGDNALAMWNQEKQKE